MKKHAAAQQAAAGSPQRGATQPKPLPQVDAPKNKPARKLGYKEARELEEIPQRIEQLEREQEEIAAALGAANLYRDNPAHAKQLQERTLGIEEELMRLMARWEALL